MKINKKPIIIPLWVVITNVVSRFYVALGYKSNVIKRFFNQNKFNWNINLIDTGKKSMKVMT